MEVDYEKLLDKAHEELPEISNESERFEIPKVRGHLQGNKTIISNFSQIAQILGRKPEHLLKYLLKELATPGTYKKGYLILGSKIPASNINKKINDYAKIYVICKECGKPDTKLNKEGNFLFMKCQACGAKTTVKSKI